MTEPAASRIAVLVNPHSGKGRGARAGEHAVEHLRQRGADVTHRIGATAADARTLTESLLSDRPDALVVVGGDGTLSAVAGTAMAAGTPVVLVPAGTGNDFARSLGIPLLDVSAAAEAALTGRSRALDVGVVEQGGDEHVFLTIVALGFDAKVSDRTNRLRFPRGRARYFLALVIELLRLRTMSFRVGYDGEEPQPRPGTLVAIGNTASYGGGMPMCAGADPTDGLLDVVHVAPLGRVRLLALFPKLLRGTHLRCPEAQHRRVRSVAVSAPDLVVYADGERVAEHACRVHIRHAGLTMLLPKGAEDDGF